VNLPHSSIGPSEISKDYTNSPAHRFRRPGSRNEKHICGPSTSLHISNLPDNVNPEDVKDFFSQDEEKAVSAKTFGPKGNMAFVSYGTTGEAIQALIRYHLAKFGDKNVKATFSHGTY
jgi:RNA recognition motif-containing protein